MADFEGTSSAETSSDFVLEMMMDEKDGEEFTREYLKARFLSSIGRSLYYARRQAGLTQAEVAERMHTTQSAVARFETDKHGSMSFRRYVDFALACGVMPRSLVFHAILEPLASLRDEMLADLKMKSSQEALVSHSQELVGTARGEIIRKMLAAQTTVSALKRAPLSIQDFKLAIEASRNAASHVQEPHADKAPTKDANVPATTAHQPTIDNQSTHDPRKAEFVYA